MSPAWVVAPLGCTTRSDIVPARAAPDLPDRSAAAIGAAAGVGRGRGKGPGGEDEDVEEEADDKGYDENQDNKEADAVWEAIAKRMDSRRKDRREAKLKQEIEKYRASNPKITEQFADLKRNLADVTPDQWDSIPEIGLGTRRSDGFVPVPDTLLEKARQEQELVTAFDPKSLAVGGTETP